VAGSKLPLGGVVRNALGLSTKQAGDAERDAVDLVGAQQRRQARLEHDGDSSTRDVAVDEDNCAGIIRAVPVGD
jgi:hypothetical protein